MKQSNSTRTNREPVLPPGNIFLLGLACLASLATLAPDEWTTRAKEYISWSGERGTMELTIGPGAEHIEGFDPQVTHTLYLKAGDLPKAVFANARWMVEVMDSESPPFRGEAVFDNEGMWEEDARQMGDVKADVGDFCKGDEEGDEAEACVPCDLSEGCVLQITIDLCGETTAGNGDDISPNLKVGIRNDGPQYEAFCKREERLPDCERLSSWLTGEVVDSPLDTCEE